MDRNPMATRLRKLGMGGRVALLTALMLLLYAVVAPLAYWHSGIPGLLAAGLPAVVCLGGAIGALLLSGHFRGPTGALTGLLLSIIVRTGLPLLLAIFLCFQPGALAKAGGVYYLVVFYVLMLGVETPLSLICTPTGNACTKVEQDPPP